jgi:hypothetical protein
VDVDAMVRNGGALEKSDYSLLIREADEHITDIRARKGYTEADLDLLTSSWVRTKGRVAQKGLRADVSECPLR